MAALERLKSLGELLTARSSILPGRAVLEFKPDDVRRLFSGLIEALGPDGFFVSTISATDLPGEGRVRLDYFVVLLPEEETLVFRTYLPRDKPVIQSVSDLVPGALPGECEAYDLLGVVFEGNAQLKRGFLAPEDAVKLDEYPLRKDSRV